MMQKQEKCSELFEGEQKDGSANRGDCDFCSVIALEIEDTGSHTFTCIGIAFEVRKTILRLRDLCTSVIRAGCRSLHM